MYFERNGEEIELKEHIAYGRETFKDSLILFTVNI